MGLKDEVELNATASSSPKRRRGAAAAASAASAASGMATRAAGGKGKSMLRPSLIEGVVCTLVVLVAVWCFVLANMLNSFVPFYEEKGRLLYQNLSKEVDLIRADVDKERRARYAAIQSVMERKYLDKHTCDRRMEREQQRCRREVDEVRKRVGTGQSGDGGGGGGGGGGESGSSRVGNGSGSTDGSSGSTSGTSGTSANANPNAPVIGDMSATMRRTYLSICMPSHPRKFRTNIVDYLSPTLDLLSDQLWGFDVKNFRVVENGFEMSKLDSSLFRVAVYDTSGPAKT